jgi:hypothetical protein
MRLIVLVDCGGETVDNRRIDPEPLSIFLAIVATVNGSIAVVNYVKTHRKPPRSRVRKKILDALAKLEDQTKYLRADPAVVRDIFGKAQTSGTRSIRLRPGVLLSP